MKHVGWEVVCPDGKTRHFPYANKDDAVCDAEAFDEECHRYKGDADQRCPGGKHAVRPCAYPDGVAEA